MAEAANSENLPLWSWPFWSAGSVQKLVSLAPQYLMQPISVGNTITVNERNSRAPDTERAIVSQESYGRQLGRMMDALVELVDDRPEVKNKAAVSELLKLHKRIEEIKALRKEERIDRVRSDLRKLAEQYPEEYPQLAAEFAAYAVRAQDDKV